MGLALIDVDGTLLHAPSSELLFLCYLFETGELKRPQAASAAAFMPRWAGRFGAQTLLRNKAYLAGMSQERVAALAEVFVHGRLNGWIRVSLIRRLDGHRRAGHRIALLTAAPDFIAGPLARLIDADAWRATRCAENGEIFVADPPTDMPYGAAKVGYARQLAEETGTSMASAHAYANALSDIPLMAAAGRATAVAPSPPLAALAIVRGWEILSLTRSAL